jgi:hypothetical protein
MDNSKFQNGRPLQRITWSEKIKESKQWFKDNADYYINLSSFHGIGTKTIAGSDANKADLQTMYNVYNNQIPLQWFEHITDPLSAKDPLHKRFPAKVRPTNILRTNIDQLLGEWLRRPFNYHVQNIGESGYNQMLEEMNQAVHQGVTQLFQAYVAQEMQKQGASQEEGQQQPTPDQVPLPEEIQMEFQATYKDKQAIKGEKWMERAMVEYNIRRILHKSFKDWLIGGEALSYKNVHNGDLVYMRLSPLYADYDKSEDTDFVEDGDWASYMFLMNSSTIVDMFYDELDEDAHKKLEAQEVTSSPRTMYSYLNGVYGETSNKIPVYLTTWKGRKRHIIIKYPDPVTGQPQEEEIDEVEYDFRKSQGEKFDAEILWVNEAYESWRIGDKTNNTFYVRQQAVPAQRNALNNFSTCKLPINGKKYSDTHSQNISLVQIGIPYLIMYIIVTRALEMTIAKSKGKILMMDNNAIPKGNGWNEERFFYYSEAMGYGLLNRNQIGVDKSWNQYHVVDMSLYDQIEQLIVLQDHFKKEWDDIIGFIPQRKGQTSPTETSTGVQTAIFQSNIITEMIYAGFDEYTQKELQGILDLSKFVNVDGLRRLYNSDMTRDQLLEIDPAQYSLADLGIFITDELKDSRAMDQTRAQVQNFVQNGMKASTALEIFQYGNVSQLKAKLKQIEAIEQQVEQQQQQSEQEAQQEAEETKLRFMEYEKMLEEQLMNVEWDRRDQNEQIKGSFAIESFGKGIDQNNNGIPDANELIKQQTEQNKIASAERQKQWELSMTERMGKLKEYVTSLNKDKEIASKERIADAANKTAIKTARMKPKPKSTKK